jgi:hypothetical protein
MFRIEQMKELFVIQVTEYGLVWIKKIMEALYVLSAVPISKVIIKLTVSGNEFKSQIIADL